MILSNAAALSTSAVTVQVSGALNLNGQSIANAVTLNGTGTGTEGALLNTTGSATVGAITLGSGYGTGAISASIGGSGSITSTGALVGGGMLVKTGSGTLTLGSSGVTAVPSARTGTTRVDAGILRVSNSINALGTSAAQVILNGGTLSLGSTASVVAHPTAVTASSGITTDAFTAGPGLIHTLGTLIIGSHTLTVSAGSNITTAGTNAGVTFGATTLQGSPTFDVQSPTTAAGGTTTLTMGALSDLGVARTLTFVNTGSGTVNGVVTLTTAMASLMEGTMVNLNNGTNAGVTLNLNIAAALGTFAQVTVNGNSVLNILTAQTIGSLTGTGTISASAAVALTIGNSNSATALNTSFTGSLINGTGTLALTKNGLGTLTLSPTTATYSGLTTVSAGILKLGNGIALGATSGVTISVGGTVDLNGQSSDRNFSSISGTGHAGGGAIINSSGTTATITGTTVLGAVAKIGGTGNITVTNAGGLTGNALLTKAGSGTLTFITTTASARSGANQIDEGMLRLQGATAVTTIGTGPMVMNGGTLSLGFDTSGTVGGAVNVLANSTIIVDRASGGAGTTLTLGAVITAGSTLTVKAGGTVSSGATGLTLGSVTIGGPSLAPGNPVFDVQSTASTTTNLTLGALSDQAIGARIITFQNSGTSPSSVTLASAATSLVDGTAINLASTGGALTLNLNNATAIGTFAQVTVGSGNIMALGTSQTINALNGSGTVSATANAVLTIGNPLSATVADSTFDGAFIGTTLSVVKAGSGTLTLGGSTSNTLSASGLAVNGGTVVLAKTGGAVAIPTKLTIGAVGSTSVASSSATVRLAGEDQIATTATVVMNALGTLDVNGRSPSLGMLAGTPGSTILNNATGTTATLTVGMGDATGYHLGSMVDNSSGTGTLALTKTGTGSVILGGWNTYTGATQVLGGSLQVGVSGMGTTGMGAVTVAGGTTLFGTGFVQGSNFTAASASVIHAGDSTLQSNYGTLTFKPASGAGVLDFQSGSTIVLGINPGGVSDLLAFTGTGTNTLLFNSNLTVTAAGFTPVSTEVFNLLDWAGLATAPEFASRFGPGMYYGSGDEAAGLDLPDVTGSGYWWDMSSFMIDGTIALVAVPEPSRTFLLGMALTMMVWRRRR